MTDKLYGASVDVVALTCPACASAVAPKAALPTRAFEKFRLFIAIHSDYFDPCPLSGNANATYVPPGASFFDLPPPHAMARYSLPFTS